MVEFAIQSRCQLLIFSEMTFQKRIDSGHYPRFPLFFFLGERSPDLYCARGIQISLTAISLPSPSAGDFKFLKKCCQRKWVILLCQVSHGKNLAETSWGAWFWGVITPSGVCRNMRWCIFEAGSRQKHYVVVNLMFIYHMLILD